MARRTFRRGRCDRDLDPLVCGPVDQRAVGQSLGVDRKTIRKYLAPAVAAGMTPGGPAMAQAEWAALVRGWFPQLADTRLRQVTWPADRACTATTSSSQLKAGVTQATIHQRLRDEHGLTASVASLKRYVAANLPEEARRDQVRGAARRRPPAGRGGADRLRPAGQWTDPAIGQAAHGVGVRDGAGAARGTCSCGRC